MKAICSEMHALVGYTDEELLACRKPCGGLSGSMHTIETQPELNSPESPVVFEFPPHFKDLLQDCEIASLSDYSHMDDSCMDLTLTTTASTTWQDSVSTFF